MELNQDNFEQTIKGNKPVIVDYWAPWCEPCKMIAPAFEAASKQITQATFAKVNVDENNRLASDQGIMNIPCIVIYKNGEEIDRLVGLQTEQQLKAKILQAIS